jgi:hypothetical protein
MPNKISSELIRLDCPISVELCGEHNADRMEIITESFKTTDIKSTTEIHRESESTSIGLDLI